MNVLLNSRLLIGANHRAAERLAIGWKPGIAIQWMVSPSDLCVLKVDPDKNVESGFGLPSGHGLRMANDLELKLRSGLNMPPFGLVDKRTATGRSNYRHPR